MFAVCDDALESLQVAHRSRHVAGIERCRAAGLNVVVCDRSRPESLDDQVDAAIEAIINAAKTEKIGDGKIFVLDVASALRVRTGDVDDDAL